MGSNDRRRATLKERSTPCQCCAFPLSHRHHWLALARYGEHEATLQLCPNCHYVYHLIGSANDGNRESQQLLMALVRSPDLRDRILGPLISFQRQAAEIDGALKRSSDLMVKDWDAIQARLDAGEDPEDISSDYQRRAGVDSLLDPPASKASG
jgi:hypothetical protein